MGLMALLLLPKPKPKHVYSPIDTPNRRRIHEIENLIQRWRSTGDLFLDDPEVNTTLEEYNELLLAEDPVRRHPLSFDSEDWTEPKDPQ